MFAAVATFVACPAVAPTLAVFEGIGAMEMVLVAVVGLLLFGGKGLPDMARTVGKMVREFKKATQGVEDEVRRVMHEEPAPPPRRLPRPTPAITAVSPDEVPSASLPPPPTPPPSAAPDGTGPSTPPRTDS